MSTPPGSSKNNQSSPRLQNFRFNPERRRRGWFGKVQRRDLVDASLLALTSLVMAMLVSVGGLVEASLPVFVSLFFAGCGAGALIWTELPANLPGEERSARLLRLAALSLAGVLLARLFLSLNWPVYLIPLPMVTAIATIAFGRRLALFHAWPLIGLVAVAVARWRGQDSPLFDVGFFFSQGVAATVMGVFCDKIKNRNSLLRAGLVSGLVIFAAALISRALFEGPSLRALAQRSAQARYQRDQLSDQIKSLESQGKAVPEPLRKQQVEQTRAVWAESVELFRNPFWGLINCAFSGFFLYEILWWIERFFGVVTRLHLVQLADLNEPLLMRLNMEAPGTYHHSQMVAQLAEAAAEKIGADSLLVRVGAYYHDIGKMAKPRYFTENNPSSSEDHGLLKPTLSALVIHAHVKDGIELGRSLGLPEKVVDFIPEHHGTTACEFFFRQAVDLARERDLPLPDKNMFRYPGPRPRSKETSIVLIADSVEAATRSLASPSPARIRHLVHEIIVDKLLDHQFDDSPISLGELAIVEDTLVRKLTWMHHARIKYPKKVETAQQSRLKELDRKRRAESKPAEGSSQESS